MSVYSIYNNALLDGKYIPTIIAYYFKEWNGYDMMPHSHNRIEIMYVISGKCIVRTRDSSYKMKRGDFVFLDGGVSHSLLVAKGDPCRMLNIEFIFEKSDHDTPLFSYFNTAMKTNPDMTALISGCEESMLLKDSDEVYHNLKSLIFELDQKNRSSTYMVQILMLELILRIARQAAEGINKESDVSSEYVKKAIKYLHSHYDFEIKINDIAKHININEAYLQRIFKSHTKKTINQYLTDIRIDKAKMLLENTDIVVMDICTYIGINSRQYFAFLFKKITGNTPNEHRKKYRNIFFRDTEESSG